MVRFPAQGTESPWPMRPTKQCCGLNAWMESIPSHATVECHLLAEDPVIVKPACAAMPLGLPNKQASISKPVACVLVWSSYGRKQYIHICSEDTSQRLGRRTPGSVGREVWVPNASNCWMRDILSVSSSLIAPI